MARDKVAPLARMEINIFIRHVAGQFPDPTSTRPKAAAYSLHLQGPAGLEQNLRRPPMLLSCHVLNSRRQNSPEPLARRPGSCPWRGLPGASALQRRGYGGVSLGLARSSGVAMAHQRRWYAHGGAFAGSALAYLPRLKINGGRPPAL
jgi:hypothetical protein